MFSLTYLSALARCCSDHLDPSSNVENTGKFEDQFLYESIANPVDLLPPSVIAPSKNSLKLKRQACFFEYKNDPTPYKPTKGKSPFQVEET